MIRVRETYLAGQTPLRSHEAHKSRTFHSRSMQARSDKVTVPSITMAVTGASGNRTLVIALSAKETFPSFVAPVTGKPVRAMSG